MDEASYSGAVGRLFMHRGILFAERLATPEYIDSLEHFPVRDTDVYLITYPKSGTVWTQQILCLIYYEGHLNKTENLLSIDRVPGFEYNVRKVNFEQLPSPRIFGSHLPHYMAPKGLKDKKAKVIYVIRNPKDNFVSHYHFINMFKELEDKPPENLEEFFENYLAGKVHSGSWFDHVKGWYTHKDEYNILFLQYEDMVKDLRGAVLKICNFVGKSLDDKTVDAIVERATFKTMKTDPLANYENMGNELSETPKKLTFLRKGTIGDWKNLLTVAQSERFDKLFQEKMKDLPLQFIWDINENI
ncbi:amine sulfotransferase-like [Lissotriton helveticus]